LSAGHYLLPTFDYSFVRVTDHLGRSVARYRVSGRPAIRHTAAGQQYYVSYALEPEVAALALGLLLTLAVVPLTSPTPLAPC
jgi:hypothetical protein